MVDNNLTYGTFAASGLADARDVRALRGQPGQGRRQRDASPISRTDHYGHLRNVGAADVGAVERQILGDFNGDGVVDIADYTTWADHFGMDRAASLAPGSFLGRGAVDIGDYTTWADHFGNVAPRHDRRPGRRPGSGARRHPSPGAPVAPAH